MHHGGAWPTAVLSTNGTDTAPKKPTNAVVTLARRAEGGDRTAMPALLEVLKGLAAVDLLGGDLALQAQLKLIDKLGGEYLVFKAALTRKAWAVLHTVKRHGGLVEQVVVLELQVPRSWLRRSRKGLWYCSRDVPPDRLRGLIDFATLARSPVEENPAAA
jgi:hypothetical protein